MHTFHPSTWEVKRRIMSSNTSNEKKKKKARKIEKRGKVIVR
jgi:hypothetical protein